MGVTWLAHHVRIDQRESIMKAGERMARAVLAAVATVLVMGACEQKPPGDKPASASAGAVDTKGGAAGTDTGKATATPSPAPAAPAPKAAGPSGASENAALAAKVKSALAAETALKPLAIDVNASDGAVTLFGTVDTRASREKAAKVAAGVEGVKSVKNNLVLVKGS